MRFLCLLVPFLISACGRADATETNVPRLSATYQGDSVRVVAAWTQPCDARGCADSYKVIWRFRNGFRLTQATADTMWYAAPRFGDSLLVSVTVHSRRRDRESGPRSAEIMLRRADGWPPPVDSVRIDTTTVALVDSFPQEVSRMADGGREGFIAVGDTTYICRLARNVFTGQVVIVVDTSWTDREIASVNTGCERARQLYAQERDG